MSERLSLFLSGAVGVALAELVYFLSLYLAGLFGRLVPWQAAEVIVFIVLLAFTLVEMPVMLFALRTMRARRIPAHVLYGTNAAYVGFAGFYALVQMILFGASPWSMVLVALCLVRWGSDLLIGNW